jgi:hypothetical protein
MGREMTVPNCEPEYTRLPILLRSLGGDHLAVKRKRSFNGNIGYNVADRGCLSRIRFFPTPDLTEQKVPINFTKLKINQFFEHAQKKI